jgi:hypothetical protein
MIMRRIQLYTFLLISIFVVSACSEAVISPTEEGHSLASSAKTTFITIDESTAGAEMPTRAALPSDGSTKATRAAVTMDEHFNLLGNDPKEFDTDAYIIHEDGAIDDNGNRHIAYLKIRWKQVKKVNGGVKLTTYVPRTHRNQLLFYHYLSICIGKPFPHPSRFHVHLNCVCRC